MNNYYHPCCIELILFINKSRHNFATVCVARQRNKLCDGVRVIVHVYAVVAAERLAPRPATARQDVVPDEQVGGGVLALHVGEVFTETGKTLIFRACVP